MEDYLNTKQFKEDYSNVIVMLVNENKKLQDRIDKATEYITNNLCDNKARVKENISGKDIDGLLEILGSDKVG